MSINEANTVLILFGRDRELYEYYAILEMTKPRIYMKTTLIIRRLYMIRTQLQCALTVIFNNLGIGNDTGHIIHEYLGRIGKDYLRN